jgi:hypothetical protein
VDPPALDKAAYDFAKAFLVRSSGDKGIMCELVEKYLHLDNTARPCTVADLFERVLGFAQSAKRAGVIS